MQRHRMQFSLVVVQREGKVVIRLELELFHRHDDDRVFQPVVVTYLEVRSGSIAGIPADSIQQLVYRCHFPSSRTSRLQSCPASQYYTIFCGEWKPT